jgi:hypothetical protein
LFNASWLAERNLTPADLSIESLEGVLQRRFRQPRAGESNPAPTGALHSPSHGCLLRGYRDLEAERLSDSCSAKLRSPFCANEDDLVTR